MIKSTSHLARSSLLVLSLVACGDGGTDMADGGMGPNMHVDAGKGDAGKGPEHDAGHVQPQKDAGSEHDAGHVGPQPVLTPGEFCTRMVAPLKAWTDFLAGCCSATALTSFEYTELTGAFGHMDQAKCEDWVKMTLAAGNITFHGEHAAACADVIASHHAYPVPAACPGGEGFDVAQIVGQVSHGQQNIYQIDACRQTFAGAFAANAPCTTDMQCSGGNYCQSSDMKTADGGIIDTCQPPTAEHEGCSGQGACAPGLLCHQTDFFAGTCEMSAQMGGEFCNYDSDCGPGLWCKGQNCAVLPLAQNLTASGQTCDAASKKFQCKGFCNQGMCAPFCAKP